VGVGGYDATHGHAHPYGFLRWKLEKDGFDDFIGLAEATSWKSGDRAKERPIRVFRLFPRGSALPGMVGVPGGDSFLFGIGPRAWRTTGSTATR